MSKKLKYTTIFTIAALTSLVLSACNGSGNNGSQTSEKNTKTTVNNNVSTKAGTNSTQANVSATSSYPEKSFLFASSFHQNYDGSSPTYDIYVYPIVNGIPGTNSSTIQTQLRSIDQMVVSADQHYLFAVSFNSSMVQAFSINQANGSLTLLSTINVTHANAIAVDPTKSVIYVSGGNSLNTLYMLKLEGNTLVLQNSLSFYDNKTYNIRSLAVDSSGKYVYASASNFYGTLMYPIIDNIIGTPIQITPNDATINNSYSLLLTSSSSLTAAYEFAQSGNLYSVVTGDMYPLTNYSTTYSSVIPLLDSSWCNNENNCNTYFNTTPDNKGLFIVSADNSIKMIPVDPATGMYKSLSLITADNTPPSGVPTIEKSFPPKIATDSTSKYLYAIQVDDDISVDSYGTVNGAAVHLRVYSIDNENQKLSYLANSKTNMSFGHHVKKEQKTNKICEPCNDWMGCWDYSSYPPIVIPYGVYYCFEDTVTVDVTEPEYANSLAVATPITYQPTLIAPSADQLSMVPTGTVSTFTIQFSKWVNHAKAESSVYISPEYDMTKKIYPADIGWSDDGKMMFSPASPLYKDTKYVLVANNISDNDGGVENDLTVHFSTSLNDNMVTLLSPNPEDKASLMPIIAIEFSDPIKQIDESNSIIITDAASGKRFPATTALDERFSNNRVTATRLDLQQQLSPNRVYSISVRNINGINSTIAYFNFITQNFVRAYPVKIRNQTRQNIVSSDSGLVVFIAHQSGGDTSFNTYGYSGNLGGIAGADDKCNNDHVKPQPDSGLCRGSCTFKALLSYIDPNDQSKSRYICDAPGQCGEGHSNNWPLKPNQEYSVIYDNMSSTAKKIHDSITTNQRYPLGITNENGIFSNNILLSPLSPLWMSNSKAWTGLNQDWTTSSNTCNGWTVSDSIEAKGRVSLLSGISFLMENRGIDDAEDDSCAVMSNMGIPKNPNDVQYMQLNYGIICIEQPN